MSSAEQPTARVAIVGAGLVGALNAIYFARRGWHVDLFELREGTFHMFRRFVIASARSCAQPMYRYAASRGEGHAAREIH